MKKDKLIIVLLILIFMFSLLWGIVMYTIDYNRSGLASIPHNISGEVWFQLISSWLLALPSIGICAYALIQTKKYHDLDEERLRPELLMKSAEILACMVNWEKFDDWAHKENNISERKLEKYREYRENHHAMMANKNYENLAFLEFEANLILKSGESVSRIIIQRITVLIGDHQYIIKFTDTIETGQRKCKSGADIQFTRSYKNGQEEYHIEWIPDFKEIVLKTNEEESRKRSKKPIRQKQDEKYECIQETFWDDLYNTVADSEYDITRRDMEWRILMNVEYGMNETRNRKKPLEAVWKIRWHETDSRIENEYMMRRNTQEGILSIVLTRGKSYEKTKY